MVFKFYINSAEPERVDKTAFLNSELSVDSGRLEPEQSVEAPAVLVTFHTFPSFNYVYIEEFNRYYFVQDIQWIGENVYRFSLKEDYLMTWKDKIKAVRAMLSRRTNPVSIDVPDDMFLTLPPTSLEVTTHKMSVPTYSGAPTVSGKYVSFDIESTEEESLSDHIILMCATGAGGVS